MHSNFITLIECVIIIIIIIKGIYIAQVRKGHKWLMKRQSNAANDERYR